jgi:UDP-glucose 4-epimerase
LKNVLVTGANGFVGSAILSSGTENRFSYRGVVRLKANIKIKCDSLIVTIASLNASTIWREKLLDIDVVIHLAARVHVMSDNSNDPLAEYREVNTEGTLNLARQSAQAGVKRFIFISSIKVNGESTSNRPSFTAFDERSPEDSYGVSKSEAEEQLFTLGHKTGMEIVIIRPPLVYGENVKANFASLMKLVGKGFPLPFRSISHNKRSLVSVYNLVALIKVCIDHPLAVNQVFLVSDDNDLSTSQMLALMAKVQGKFNFSVPVPTWCLKLAGKIFKKEAVVDRLVGSLQLDIEHTKNTLNWAPPYTAEHGFKLAAKKVL